MTAKTDLPPLPERFDCTNGSAQWCYGCYTMTRDDLGDYVLAEDYDALRNAAEALQAEVEALRAELDESCAVVDKLARLLAETATVIKGPEPDMTKWSYHDIPDGVRAIQSRAERLAEALRELEEREQRDEALLRQALEALEILHDELLQMKEHAESMGVRKGYAAIIALREQLVKGDQP